MLRPNIVAVETSSTRIEQLLSASRAIYIVDSSGILLHHEFFLGQEEDPDLYSGLFAAVNVYARELQAGNIMAIKLDDFKFIFQEHDETGYLIVLDVNNEMSDRDGKWLLSQIIKRFDATQRLIEEDYRGSFNLETLFEDRGKEINWTTINAIREDALENQKLTFDKVDTLNLTRINLKNRLWVKIRKMVTTLVENQKGLVGLVLDISKNDHLNILYCGREREEMDKIQNYIAKKFDDNIGLELETERIQIDDLFCALYPLLCADGGILGLASRDKYLITRLNNQMERMVAAIEKLGISS